MDNNCTNCNRVLSDTYKLDKTCEQYLFFSFFYAGSNGFESDIYSHIKNNINKVLHIDQTSPKDMRKAIFNLLIKSNPPGEIVKHETEPERFTFDKLLHEDSESSLNCMALCKGNLENKDSNSILCIPLTVEATVFHNPWTGTLLVFGAVRFRCHISIDNSTLISTYNGGKIKLSLQYMNINEDGRQRDLLIQSVVSASTLKMKHCHFGLLLNYMYALCPQNIICDVLTFPDDIVITTYSTKNQNNYNYCLEQTRKVVDVIKIHFNIHIQEMHGTYAILTIEDNLRSKMHNTTIELNEALIDELHYPLPSHFRMNKIPNSLIELIYKKVKNGFK